MGRPPKLKLAPEATVVDGAKALVKIRLLRAYFFKENVRTEVGETVTVDEDLAMRVFLKERDPIGVFAGTVVVPAETSPAVEAAEQPVDTPVVSDEPPVLPPLPPPEEV
jgi:hypothetical protein